MKWVGWSSLHSAWKRPRSLDYELLYPSTGTQCEVQVGLRSTVHVCSHMGVLRTLSSELLDPSTVTQCEVQVGYRYAVYMCGSMGATWVALLTRVLNYWILAPLHSVRYRVVIVTQCL